MIVSVIPKPDYQRGPVRLWRGDCLQILPLFSEESIDCVIADPPYCSGARTRAELARPTKSKYIQTGTVKQYANFMGDNRSQRGWMAWCGTWMSHCLRMTREAGYAMMFTDWRQLPVAADVLEAGGYVHRGIIAWDKGNTARAPHKGYFRHQCEYLVWGTCGTSRPTDHAGPFPGCFSIRVNPREKLHIAGKPVALLEQLVEVVPPGQTILDPFMGSASTAIACIRKGREFLGIELDPVSFDVACQRIDKELSA